MGIGIKETARKMFVFLSVLTPHILFLTTTQLWHLFSQDIWCHGEIKCKTSLMDLNALDGHPGQTEGWQRPSLKSRSHWTSLLVVHYWKNEPLIKTQEVSLSRTGEQVWGRWHSPKVSVLGDYLRMLKLPSFKGHWEALRRKAIGWDC